MQVMLTREAYLDLRKVFSAEELQNWGDRVIYMQLANQKEATPIALEITDFPFLQENGVGNSRVYFAFVGGSPRTEATVDLLNWMLNWTK